MKLVENPDENVLFGEAISHEYRFFAMRELEKAPNKEMGSWELYLKICNYYKGHLDYANIQRHFRKLADARIVDFSKKNGKFHIKLLKKVEIYTEDIE